MPRLLVADCRDSFVHTIVSYLRALGAEVVVESTDTLTIAQAETVKPDGVLLSPGPGTPEEAKICHELLDRYAGEKPMLGVCLGHQVIATYWGGQVGRAPELRHGETSPVEHDGRGVFADLPHPLTATRYHSLTVDPATVGSELEVTARTSEGIIMGLRHRSLAVEGIQFHPEAILTESGSELLNNWLKHVKNPQPVRA